MTTETIVQISSRSRNLGIGWSTEPSGRGTGITPPAGPDAIGGLRAIEREMERLGRVMSGGVYKRVRLFVGRKPVMAFDWGGEWCNGERDLQYLLGELRRGSVVSVRLADEEEGAGDDDD